MSDNQSDSQEIVPAHARKTRPQLSRRERRVQIMHVKEYATEHDINLLEELPDTIEWQNSTFVVKGMEYVRCLPASSINHVSHIQTSSSACLPQEELVVIIKLLHATNMAALCAIIMLLTRMREK